LIVVATKSSAQIVHLYDDCDAGDCEAPVLSSTDSSPELVEVNRFASGDEIHAQSYVRSRLLTRFHES
jgi:hypothetical protein